MNKLSFFLTILFTNRPLLVHGPLLDCCCFVVREKQSKEEDHRTADCYYLNVSGSEKRQGRGAPTGITAEVFWIAVKF